MLLRGATVTGDPTDALGTGSTLASSASALGSISGATATEDGGFVIVAAGRNNDMTDGASFSVLTGNSLTWAELSDYGGGAGEEFGLAIGYAPIPTAVAITAKSFTIAGNSVAAPGAGQMWILAPLALVQDVQPSRVESTAVIAEPAVGVGPVTVNPALLPAASVVRLPSVAAGPVTIAASSIDSAEAFGTALVLDKVISPATGIASSEAFGGASVVVAAVTITTAGIDSVEAFGTSLIRMVVAPASIASAEAFGPETRLAISPLSIATGQAVPSPGILVGSVTVTVPGIGSAEVFGEPELTVTVDPVLLSQRRKPRLHVTYELQCIARIPQASGAPTFLEIDQIEWESITWSSTLSQPQELSARCPLYSFTPPVVQRLNSWSPPLPTELWLFRDGEKVFAGPLKTWRRSGNIVELAAIGLLGYLQNMIVLADLRYDQIDQFTIAKALVDQYQQGLPYANVGIDTSTVGLSGKLRDRSYVRNEQHQVSRRLEELGAVNDGFDAEIDPQTRKLQLWYPRKGVDRSSGHDAIVFDDRNITTPDVMFSVAPGDLASEAFGSSNASGSDTSLWSAQSNAELRAAYGAAAVMGSWQDVSEQATLDDHTRALLDARDQPLIVPGPRTRVTPDADLSAYDVGDLVRFEMDPAFGVAGSWRIRKRSVTVEATGQEFVDMEFV